MNLLFSKCISSALSYYDLKIATKLQTIIKQTITYKNINKQLHTKFGLLKSIELHSPFNACQFVSVAMKHLNNMKEKCETLFSCFN